MLLSISNLKIFERVTTNEITIYEDAIVYDRLFIVAKIYFTIWKDSEKSINISKKKLNINFDYIRYEIEYFENLFTKIRKSSDNSKEFDRLYIEEKINWTIEFILYDYLVFVV